MNEHQIGSAGGLSKPAQTGPDAVAQPEGGSSQTAYEQGLAAGLRMLQPQQPGGQVPMAQQAHMMPMMVTPQSAASVMAGAATMAALRPERRDFPYGLFIIGLFIWPVLIIALIVWSVNNKAFNCAMSDYSRGIHAQWYWDGYNSPPKQRSNKASK